MNDRSSGTLRLALVALATMICMKGHAQPAPSLSMFENAIRDLNRELGRLAQSSGQWEVLRAAEQRTADHIRAAIAAKPDDAQWADAPRGMTPLMSAAMSGYPLVVEALLTSPRARAQIEAEARGAGGATAWGLSNFSWMTAAWSCHAGFLNADDPFQAASRLINTGYFLMAPENPYQQLRQMLVMAGAKADLERAKKAWLTMCPTSDAALKERVRASDDLLLTLTHDGRARLMRFESELRSAAANVVTPAPTSGDWAIRPAPPPHAVAPPAQSLPVPSPPGATAAGSPLVPTTYVPAESVCDVAPEQAMPSQAIGVRQARVRVRVRAMATDGRITIREVTMLDPHPGGSYDLGGYLEEARATVRRYRCRGTHAIEKTFERVF